MPATVTPPAGATAQARNVWIDVEDLFEYAVNQSRPSGIQRLSFEIYRAMAAEWTPAPRFCRHDRIGNTMREVPWSAVERLFARLTGGGGDGGAAPRAAVPAAATLHHVVPARPAAARPVGRMRHLASRLPAEIRLPLGEAVRAQRASLRAASQALRGAGTAWRERLRRPAPEAERAEQAEQRPNPPAAAGADLATAAGPGDVLLVLGSPWSRTDYADVVRGLQRASGVRFGLLVYDLIPLLRPEFCDQSLVRMFSAWYTSVLPLADRVFTISRATAADVSAFAARRDVPLRSAPRPVPVGTGFPVAAERGPPPPLPTGLAPGSYALAVSTIEARKNHVLLFRAWRHLLESRPAASVPKLVFAGRVGWLVADLMQQIENARNLDGHLVLVPEPSDAELAALYRGCRFTLFPSLYEGWGLPITESLGFGKPCIASDRTSMPEAGGPLARYADPEHVGAWVDAVGRLLDDPDDLAAWEARVRREFVPVPWSATAAALRDGLDPGPPGGPPSASTVPAAP